MTTPDPDARSASPEPAAPDRIYRSPAGLGGGVLLLALCVWLGGDAIISGSGRTPWLALAALLCAVPLVVAFTLRPAVYANEERLRVRNPFRTVLLPWRGVVSLRSGYSNEVVDAAGAKFQLWALPVSLRGRKKVARKQARVERGGGPGLGFGRTATAAHEITKPATDTAMEDLRVYLPEEGKVADPSSPGTQVRWAWAVIAPAVAGAILLIVLLAV